MNCSESRRLQRLLGRLLQELRGGGPAPPNGSSWALDPTGGPTSPAAARRAGDDAYLYILLIMIFYGCLAGGLIVAYTRSKKLESKHDPYHLYIERDWAAAAAAAPPANAANAGEGLGSADSERP